MKTLPCVCIAVAFLLLITTARGAPVSSFAINEADKKSEVEKRAASVVGVKSKVAILGDHAVPLLAREGDSARIVSYCGPVPDECIRSCLRKRHRRELCESRCAVHCIWHE